MSFDTEATRMSAMIASGVGMVPYPDNGATTAVGYDLAGIYRGDAAGDAPPPPVSDDMLMVILFRRIVRR